jgi:hypothetical protein
MLTLYKTTKAEEAHQLFCWFPQLHGVRSLARVDRIRDGVLTCLLVLSVDMIQKRDFIQASNVRASLTINFKVES